MSDLVLIHPGAVHGIYGDLGNDLVAVEPPLWCRLIAGYVRDRGWSVSIIDAEAEGLGAMDVVSRIGTDRPRLVCLAVYGHQPSASTQQMIGASAIARAIKACLPYVKILMAGGHIAALPERTLLEEAIDYACCGEGPLTVAGLLQGDDNRDIPGLVWLDGDAVCINHTSPLITNLDKDLHGNAWDLLPMHKYRAHNWQCFGDLAKRQPYASIYTSLGCPFKCLSGDTPVNTIYGNIPIRDLARTFGEWGIPVYTYDPETRRAFIADAFAIRKYGEGEELVRVHFDDGTHIDCTPDHRFLQFKWGNGKSPGQQWQCEAQNLATGAHVRALRLEQAGHGYIYVTWGRRDRRHRSRMVMDYLIGRTLSRQEHVHHRDHDKSNDHPGNLEYCPSARDHRAFHPEVAARMRAMNPTRHGMSQSWRDNISAAIVGRRRTPESIESYRIAAASRNSNAIYREKLSAAASARADRERGWTWWTTPQGKSYRASEARDAGDSPGRIGFNPHQARQGTEAEEINHVVTRVERLIDRADVYCLTVPSTGWFFANNVLVKNCSFCCINAPFQSNRYRMRSPQSVVAEIEMLHERFGVATIKIIDEMFVMNERHYTAICEGVIASGLGDKLNIWAYARVDTVKPHTLKMFREAGIRWLALGIESGSKHVRDGADKALKNDDIIGVVRSIQAAGINVIGNYIFGLPDDDLASMKATLALATEANTEFANFYCAMAYPGSRLYDEALAKGWTLPETWAGYSQHNEHCRPLDTRHVDAATVLKFRDDAFDSYFTNPAYLDGIRKRFGEATVEHVRRMTTYKLKRNLLECASPIRQSPSCAAVSPPE